MLHWLPFRSTPAEAASQSYRAGSMTAVRDEAGLSSLHPPPARTSALYDVVRDVS